MKAFCEYGPHKKFWLCVENPVAWIEQPWPWKLNIRRI